MPRKFKPSPFALAVLTLLHEEPMHPYRMQRLIKDRGKDQVINVRQRASLYQTIDQLLRAGLITFWDTEREEGYPERTIYRLTDKGHTAAVSWLRDMLSSPAQEFPQFPAAVSLLPLLTPDDAVDQLELRDARLTEQIEQLDAEMKIDIPRLFLLETEYLRSVLEAELQWVRSITAALRAGELTWDQAWMHPADPPEREA